MINRKKQKSINRNQFKKQLIEWLFLFYADRWRSGKDRISNSWLYRDMKINSLYAVDQKQNPHFCRINFPTARKITRYSERTKKIHRPLMRKGVRDGLLCHNGVGNHRLRGIGHRDRLRRIDRVDLIVPMQLELLIGR